MNKILRNSHGFLGLVFGVFLLIQGLTACLLAFEKPLETAFGESKVKLIENIHKGKIYGNFKKPYNALTGLALCYLSFSGIFMGLNILKAKRRKS